MSARSSRQDIFPRPPLEERLSSAWPYRPSYASDRDFSEVELLERQGTAMKRQASVYEEELDDAEIELRVLQKLAHKLVDKIDSLNLLGFGKTEEEWNRMKQAIEYFKDILMNVERESDELQLKISEYAQQRHALLHDSALSFQRASELKRERRSDARNYY